MGAERVGASAMASFESAGMHTSSRAATVSWDRRASRPIANEVQKMTWGPMSKRAFTVAGVIFLFISGMACGGGSSSQSGPAGSYDAGHPPDAGPQPTSKKTLGVVKAGAGTIRSTPAGIDCGANCSAAFDAGTTISLIAVADAGWKFAGWGGACDAGTTSVPPSAGSACSLVLSSDSTASATFLAVPPQTGRRYALTVTRSGTGHGEVTTNPGGIDCGPTCSSAFDEGEVISLSATPTSGSRFAGWTGACNGPGPCTVVARADATVDAAFQATPPPPPAGDPGVWVPVGPGGGPVIQVAVDPADARVALAAGLNRMFRTTDGGLRWKDTGVVPRVGVQSVAFSIAAPQRAWAVDFDGVLFSSTDAGETWSGPERSLAVLWPSWGIR